MNLYDRDDGFKTFTIDEANSILPQVISETERTVRLLKTIRDDCESQQIDEAEAQRKFEEESAHTLEAWSREIANLGAYPKGFFTVDFKSPVPDTLFCWTLGEDRILHTHKTYESFKDRVPIRNDFTAGFDDQMN